MRLIFFFLLFVTEIALGAPPPRQPPQPLEGPGGSRKINQDTTVAKFGSGGTEYWIFEPSSPRPTIAPVIIFVHGWCAMNPVVYGGWIEHLVGRGNIVIYPRYQASIRTRAVDFLPNTAASVGDALHRLSTEPNHVKPDTTKLGVVGHSAGAVIGASLVATTHQFGLPPVRALMAVEPGRTWKRAARGTVPLSDLSQIPAGTLLLSLSGDEDEIVRDIDAKRIFMESTKVSIVDKNYVILHSDTRGSPPLVAGHTVAGTLGGSKALNQAINDLGFFQRFLYRRAERSAKRWHYDALDYYGLWKLFDGLTDAAFFNRNREYALGNTPKQRYMGTWSDGTPVQELTVIDSLDALTVAPK